MELRELQATKASLQAELRTLFLARSTYTTSNSSSHIIKYIHDHNSDCGENEFIIKSDKWRGTLEEWTESSLVWCSFVWLAFLLAAIVIVILHSWGTSCTLTEALAVLSLVLFPFFLLSAMVLSIRAKCKNTTGEQSRGLSWLAVVCLVGQLGATVVSWGTEAAQCFHLDIFRFNIPFAYISLVTLLLFISHIALQKPPQLLQDPQDRALNQALNYALIRAQQNRVPEIVMVYAETPPPELVSALELLSNAQEMSNQSDKKYDSNTDADSKMKYSYSSFAPMKRDIVSKCQTWSPFPPTLTNLIAFLALPVPGIQQYQANRQSGAPLLFGLQSAQVGRLAKWGPMLGEAYGLVVLADCQQPLEPQVIPLLERVRVEFSAVVFYGFHEYEEYETVMRKVRDWSLDFSPTVNCKPTLYFGLLHPLSPVASGFDDVSSVEDVSFSSSLARASPDQPATRPPCVCLAGNAHKLLQTILTLRIEHWEAL